jgi:ABC-type multidrug transport system ATPase subunit
VIAIDGFETGLHPRTQISAIQAIDEYASAAGISVVLTTQSPTVLDWIDRPERVFVLDHGRGPKPLIDLKTSEWLAQFRLGHGFSQGDYGNG